MGTLFFIQYYPLIRHTTVHLYNLIKKLFLSFFIFFAFHPFLSAKEPASCFELENRWRQIHRTHVELRSRAERQQVTSLTAAYLTCKQSASQKFDVLMSGARAAYTEGKRDDVGYFLKEAHKFLPALSENEAAMWYRLRGNAAWVENKKFDAAWHYAQAFTRFDHLNSHYEKAAISLSMALVWENSNNPEVSRKFLTLAQKILSGYKGNPLDVIFLRARIHVLLADNLILENVDLGKGDLKVNEALSDLIPLLKQDVVLMSKYNKSSSLVNSVITLGQIYFYLENYDKATSYYEEAKELAFKSGLTERLAFIYYRKGQLEQRLGRTQVAISLYKKALELALQKNAQNLIPRIQNRYGFSLEQLGQFTEAEKIYRQYIAHVEKARSELGISDFGKTVFMSNENAGYLGLVRILIKTGREEEALYWLDATRGRFLQNLNQYATWVKGLRASERSKLHFIETKIAELREKSLLPTTSATDMVQPLQTFVQQALLQAEANRMWQSKHTPVTLEREHYSSYFLQHLQQKLKENNQVALFYYIDRELDPSINRELQSFVVAVTHQALKVFPLQIKGVDLAQKIKTLYNQRERSTHLDLGVLHELHEGLFVPVKNFISGYERVVLFKDDQLVQLPFSMLVSNVPKQRYNYSQADFLVKQFAFSQELSIPLYVAQKQEPTILQQNLIFGRSRFGSAEHLAPLPGVFPEIRNIGGMLPQARIGLDGGATEWGFKNEMKKSHLMHLASHTILSPENPLYTFLSLRRSKNNDGKLFLFEFFHERLQAELVTLSSCNSGVGEHLPGEGFVGMQYALRSAGVKSVLATNWPAADKTFPKLMQVFYLGLKNGLSKDQALRFAQLQILQSQHSKMGKSPYFWASLMLYGNATPLAFGSVSVSTHSRPAMAFLLLFVLLMGFQYLAHKDKN